VRRIGLSWSKDEIADIERLARRKPLLGGRQIVIMTALEHAEDMRAKLLKVLEEPPTATVFLLLADDMPEDFSTIASRCAEVPFTTLRVDDLVHILQRDGHDEIAARIAAEAAGGDLDRARLLLEDDGVTARMEFWRHVPRLLSTRSPADLAHDIGAQIELAMQPMYVAQEAEMEQLLDEAEMLGRRGVVNRKEVEKRHKREQRRYRTDDILFGFAVLARTYRERMVGALEALDEGDRRSRHEAKGSARAIDELGRAADALRGNADADFLLTTLFTTLAGL
jgi:DNA polymerase-3 subunit delta'